MLILLPAAFSFCIYLSQQPMINNSHMWIYTEHKPLEYIVAYYIPEAIVLVMYANVPDALLPILAKAYVPTKTEGG